MHFSKNVLCRGEDSTICQTNWLLSDTNLWLGRESNSHEGLTSHDFESCASAIPPPSLTTTSIIPKIGLQYPCYGKCNRSQRRNCIFALWKAFPSNKIQPHQNGQGKRHREGNCQKSHNRWNRGHFLSK